MGALKALVLNAGSSTVKFGLFNGHSRAPEVYGSVEKSGPGAFDRIVRRLEKSPASLSIGAVGHRIVHGGTDFQASVLINGRVKSRLEKLTVLAPLHNPPALDILSAAQAAFPKVPQVAVFDTAYYAGLPPEQYVYPLPYHWHQKWGIRRYGFHGISHSSCAERAGSLLKPGARLSRLRVVSCHLGSGCSATASLGGKAVATTMGFTPLEGLMMGARPGSVDPGLLVHVQRRLGVSLREMEAVLNRKSGLMGVSGVSDDFRKVERAARSGHERSRLALKMYAVRVRSAVGSLAATLGGLDALVFTGGVGENAAALRREVCRGLEFLGVRLDEEKNKARSLDADVSAKNAKASVLVLKAGEEEKIARETWALASV